ncbi:MAG: hypothetical protein J6X51_00230 [Bacteroidales bacterium]|nr:hypothetical protein [Bacteroidales bacterium]
MHRAHGVDIPIYLFRWVSSSVPGNDRFAVATCCGAASGGRIALTIRGLAPAAATGTAVALVTSIIGYCSSGAALVATAATAAAFT